jgi:phage repressor protein C with HTH and peptisase S24 domain
MAVGKSINLSSGQVEPGWPRPLLSGVNIHGRRVFVGHDVTGHDVVTSQSNAGTTITINVGGVASAGNGGADSLGTEPEVVPISDDKSYRIEGLLGLRVQGDSMTGANINDGDIVLVKPVCDDLMPANGSIVVAWHTSLNSEPIVKYFFYHQISDEIDPDMDEVSLESANPRYRTIRVPSGQVHIQGIVVYVVPSVAAPQTEVFSP